MVERYAWGWKRGGGKCRFGVFGGFVKEQMCGAGLSFAWESKWQVGALRWGKGDGCFLFIGLRGFACCEFGNHGLDLSCVIAYWPKG